MRHITMFLSHSKEMVLFAHENFWKIVIFFHLEGILLKFHAQSTGAVIVVDNGALH